MMKDETKCQISDYGYQGIPEEISPSGFLADLGHLYELVVWSYHPASSNQFRNIYGVWDFPRTDNPIR